VNTALYRNKIQTVIDKTFPTPITLKRNVKVEKTYGDWINEEIDVVSKNGFLSSETSSSMFRKTLLEILGKADFDNGYELMIAADESFEVLKGDYFYIGSKKYTVKASHLQFNIYWEIRLEEEVLE
jgi:hypothetical protein